jgi:hypothetical protein
MDHRLICTWLGLPPTTSWPPDHYTLLGLPPGEEDRARIEQQAQERLARIRCYQIKHPEQVTEALNLLAQALVCLTDPEAKRRYDRSLGLLPPTPPSAAAAAEVPFLPATLLDTELAPPATQLDWRGLAPPLVAASQAMAAPATPHDVALATPLPEAAPPPFISAPQTNGTETLPPPAPVVPPAPPPDPFLEAARSSPAARRGLGTRQALLRRLLQTRTLLRTWKQLGRYLAHPRRRLQRSAEAVDLVRQLTRLDRQLQDFPPLLGQPGGPGYRLVMLARDEHPASTFRALGWEERKALALDWKAGRQVLLAHRRYLGELVRQLRRQPLWQRLLRPARAWVNDHPVWTTLLSVAALILAVCTLMQYLP